MKDLLLIERPDIVAIADAIRAKTGQNGSMTLEQMPGEIAGIQNGGSSGGSGGDIGVCVTATEGCSYVGKNAAETVANIKCTVSITAEDVTE